MRVVLKPSSWGNPLYMNRHRDPRPAPGKPPASLGHPSPTPAPGDACFNVLRPAITTSIGTRKKCSESRQTHPLSHTHGPPRSTLMFSLVADKRFRIGLEKPHRRVAQAAVSPAMVQQDGFLCVFMGFYSSIKILRGGESSLFHYPTREPIP